MTRADGRGRHEGLTPAARVRFQEFEDFLAREEPELRLEIDPISRRAKILGNIAVDIGAGVRRGFSVELRFDGLDPSRTPRVWDRGRRFRPDGERHVEDHGALGWRFCLELDASPDITFTAPDGLAQLLANLRGFIRKQLIYEDRKRQGHPRPWPGSAWDHGTGGYVEWIEEALGEMDAAGLRRLYPFLTIRRLAANKKCPCGSGNKAGDCHREAANLVRTAQDRGEIERALAHLIAKREKP